MVPRPRPSTGALLAAVVAAALVAPALAGSATASPRPVAVCEPCDRGFVDAARGHGVDVRVERSTATMRVHRNGTATWTVENRLSANASAFRENATLRRSVAREAVAVHDARLLSTAVDGDRVRLRYRTPDAATEAPGGVLRVDYFRDDPGLRVYTDLGADRLTLVAPEGMVVERGLPGADTSGRRTTVTSFEGDGDGPFVTLVPEGRALAPLWSLLAVALPPGSVVGRNLLLLVAVPTLGFVAGLRAVAWGVARVDPGSDARRGDADPAAVAVVGLGLLAAAHPLYAGVVGVVGTTPPLVAGGVGAVALGGALSVPAVRERLDFARLAGAVAAAFGVAVLCGAVLSAVPAGDLAVHGEVVTAVAPVLPVYAATLVGYATARGRLRAGLAVAAGAFAVVPALTFSIASQGGTLYFLGVALGVVGAVAGVVAGVPPFLLGYGLAPGADEAAGRGA
jgi:hypothetical protein